MPRAPPLTIRSVTYQTESGQVVTVDAAEMLAGAEELAKCNGWKIGDMLANKPLRAGKRLKCLVATHLPKHWRQVDSSGYILMRFKSALMVRGHSFLGGASADKDMDFTLGGHAACAESGRMLHAEIVNSPDSGETFATPRRSKRARSVVISYSDISPLSGDDNVGRTQWLEERFHRALFAATCPADQLEDGYVLHACGNPMCAAVSHYYLGDQESNALDTSHHAKKPNTSRLSLPKLQ